MNDTKQYYQDNAQAFFDSTVNADMSAHYEHFLKYVPEHSRILDFGCGSGRDTKAFLQRGYLVDAIDGSSEMCRLASELCNIQVKCMDFTDLNDGNKYDAIWACASLLHIAKTQLTAVLIKMRDALVNGGVMYISFKYGDYEGERNGRFFLDFTPEAFSDLISSIPGLVMVEDWFTEDVRSENSTRWYNIIIKKQMNHQDSSGDDNVL